MAVDGYIRVSRVAGREGDSFISPAVQQEQIEGWAKARGATVGTWHRDLDMSGARTDRPGLADAIVRVERGESQGIVVARLDRLARSLPVAFETINRIEAAGGQLVSVQEGVDPSTASGRMMRSLLLVLAEWYRDQVREGWETARERAVRRGVAVMSTVPTGYQRGQDGRLEPHPRWAPVIREVFERRARGDGWADLARFVNELGVPVQYASGRDRGVGRWTGATVSKVVANRVYLGEVRHGEFVNDRAHEPLVNSATWHAAQAARGVPGERRDGGQSSLLAGLVRCSGCGYTMYRSLGRGPRGTKLAGYRCRGGGSGGVCPDRAYAPAEQLEDLVQREFLRHAEDLAVRGDAPTAELEEVLTNLEEAEEALRVFTDDPRVVRTLGQERFVAGLQERKRRVDEAKELVKEAQRPVAGVPDVITLRAMWPDLDVVGRRRLLNAAIGCVVAAGRGDAVADRVRVCWAGLEPDDLPHRGKRGGGLRPIPLDGLPPDSRVGHPGQVAQDT